MDLLSRLMEDEGFSPVAYECPAGKLTIGYGRNIDPVGGKGITQSEGINLLMNDIKECEFDLQSFFGSIRWDAIGAVRQNALLNMRFQMGPGGFRSFRKMLEAIADHDWEMAAREALDSKWAGQTPNRASRIAQELRTGVSLW